MSDAQALQKQLRIKSGVVERLIKELAVYQKEEETEVKRVEKLKADGAEGADIRQAEAVLKEAQKMVPDAQTRMSAAVQELRDLVELAKDFSPPFPQDDEMLLKAKEALEKAET
ncbi:hypothetical protein FRC00_001685 [Tulasnella sp. 408]|nr:hypothetical protein FRC00_001685 [Tulasnella sp. 408]